MATARNKISMVPSGEMVVRRMNKREKVGGVDVDVYAVREQLERLKTADTGERSGYRCRDKEWRFWQWQKPLRI